MKAWSWFIATSWSRQTLCARLYDLFIQTWANNYWNRIL